MLWFFISSFNQKEKGHCEEMAESQNRLKLYWMSLQHLIESAKLSVKLHRCSNSLDHKSYTIGINYRLKLTVFPTKTID